MSLPDSVFILQYCFWSSCRVCFQHNKARQRTGLCPHAVSLSQAWCNAAWWTPRLDPDTSRQGWWPWDFYPLAQALLVAKKRRNLWSLLP